jgi:hypothetical protein
MSNVHVVDKRLFPNVEELRAFIDQLSDLSGDNIAFRVDGRWILWGICRRVRNLAREIGVLRIYCHGNASFMELGQGLREPAHTWNFRELRGCWIGRYPRIEIHACAVASATPVRCAAARATAETLPAVCVAGTVTRSSRGVALVQSIANNAGVLAMAAYHAQLPTVFGYEGDDIIHCRPSEYYTRAALIGGA